MSDLPGPGIEPMSPALAGGFLTTVPPGKPLYYLLACFLFVTSVLFSFFPSNFFWIELFLFLFFLMIPFISTISFKVYLIFLVVALGFTVVYLKIISYWLH